VSDNEIVLRKIEALARWTDAHPLIAFPLIVLVILAALIVSIFEVLTFCGLYDWITPLLSKKRGKK